MIPLFVDLETEWRGGQSQALLLLQGLYERGHAAELVAAEGSVLGHRARAQGIYVHSVSRGSMRIPAAMKIRGLLGDGRIELVHANEGHALTAAWLARAYRSVPVLCSRRIGFPLRTNFVSKSRYQILDRFIANSKHVAQTLYDSGITEEQVAIVNEGVEIPTLFTAEERKRAREQWGVAEDEFLFGCASAFVPEKGQRHVVGALRSVREQFPKAKLLLAGDGRNLAADQDLARTLGLVGAALFPGFVVDMPLFYAALDAFVFPSEFEGLGTALQAAMAYGLPVISTTRGALSEVVEAGRTALVAEPDAAAFSSAMIELMSDSNLRKRLGLAGREDIAKRFSADLMVENTLAVYEQVL